MVLSSINKELSSHRLQISRLNSSFKKVLRTVESLSTVQVTQKEETKQLRCQMKHVYNMLNVQAGLISKLCDQAKCVETESSPQQSITASTVFSQQNDIASLEDSHVELTHDVMDLCKQVEETRNLVQVTLQQVAHAESEVIKRVLSCCAAAVALLMKHISNEVGRQNKLQRAFGHGCCRRVSKVTSLQVPCTLHDLRLILRKFKSDSSTPFRVLPSEFTAFRLDACRTPPIYVVFPDYRSLCQAIGMPDEYRDLSLLHTRRGNNRMCVEHVMLLGTLYHLKDGDRPQIVMYPAKGCRRDFGAGFSDDSTKYCFHHHDSTWREERFESTLKFLSTKHDYRPCVDSRTVAARQDDFLLTWEPLVQDFELEGFDSIKLLGTLTVRLPENALVIARTFSVDQLLSHYLC